MKKLLVIVLMLTMSIALFACGEEATPKASATETPSASASAVASANFEGDFTTEASSTEASEKFSAMETKNPALFDENLDGVGDLGWNGYQLKMSGTITTPQTSGDPIITTMTADGKMTFTETGTLDKGVVKSTSGTSFVTTSYDMYLANNYVYIHTNLLGTETKIKYSMGSAASANYASSYEGSEIINAIKEFVKNKDQMATSGVKVYIDESESGTKIKIDMSNVSGIPAAYGTYNIIISLDAQCNLLGAKVSVVSTESNVVSNISYEMTPYSGTVELPSDLDQYTAA